MTTRPIVRTIRNLWIVDFWRLWISCIVPRLRACQRSWPRA